MKVKFAKETFCKCKSVCRNLLHTFQSANLDYNYVSR